MKLCFGDIVVVENSLIGVVVKSWKNFNNEVSYDIYVREYNAIKRYSDIDVERYMVRHKYLSEEEIEWQNTAMKE